MRRKFQVLTAILSNTQNYRVILAGTAGMYFFVYCYRKERKPVVIWFFDLHQIVDSLGITLFVILLKFRTTLLPYKPVCY